MNRKPFVFSCLFPYPFPLSPYPFSLLLKLWSNKICQKKKIGYLLIGLIVIILIVKFSFKDEIDKIIKGTDKKTAKASKTYKVNKKILILRKDVIKEIRNFYNVLPFRTIRVFPVLNEGVKRKELQFDYKWFINDQEIDNNKMIMISELFKKGDEIYCIITPIRNNKELDKVKSELFIIKNTPPKIIYSSQPSFNDMGEFIYRINATDIDGDKLTYTLIDPEEKISIDMSTGDINWDIKKKDLSKKPDNRTGEDGEEIENEYDISSYKKTIKFKVTDSEGAETLGSITFNTATGSEGEE